MARADRQQFTLRLDDETRAALRLAARELHISMNTLAEGMITRELDMLMAGLDEHLSRTLEALRAHRPAGHDADWDAFAAAEVEEEDPLQARRVTPRDADRYGLAAIFA